MLEFLRRLALSRRQPAIALSPDLTAVPLPAPLVFARSSAAIGLGPGGMLTSASPDMPRQGADGALLIEPGRSNLIESSGDFSTGWSLNGLHAFGAGSNVNAQSAPDISLSADEIVEDSSVGGHTAIRNVSFTSGEIYTLSVYARRGAAPRNLYLLMGSGAFGANIEARFDLGQASAITHCAGTDTASGIEPLADGWLRCWVRSTCTSSTASQTHIGLLNADMIRSYPGDGSAGLLVWGAQLEAGAGGPTSLVATSGGIEARAPDLVSAPLGAWWNPVAGTLQIEAVWHGGAGVLWQADNGTEDERIRIACLSDGDISCSVQASGVEQAAIIPGRINPRTGFHLALSWQAKGVTAALDGPNTAVSGSISLPALTAMRLGSAIAGETWNGTIARLCYRGGPQGDAWLKRVTNGG